MFWVFLVVFCFVLFVFVLFLVCPMLPGSINCQFLIIPSDFSNVYLPTFDSVPILSMKHPIEYSLCFWSSPVADPAFGSCYMRMIGRLQWSDSIKSDCLQLWMLEWRWIRDNIHQILQIIYCNYTIEYIYARWPFYSFFLSFLVELSRYTDVNILSDVNFRSTLFWRKTGFCRNILCVNTFIALS
jgi:hypothetical protein